MSVAGTHGSSETGGRASRLGAMGWPTEHRTIIVPYKVYRDEADYFTISLCRTAELPIPEWGALLIYPTTGEVGEKGGGGGKGAP